MQRKLFYSIIAVYLGAVALGAGIVYGGTFLTTKTVTNNVPKPAHLTMVSEGHNGGTNGTDNRPHDTIMPENITVFVGQEVDLTVINYDEGPHSITSTTLVTSSGTGIDLSIPGRTALGVPSVTNFPAFTPTQAGTYLWKCITPCDAGQGYWAMGGPSGTNPVPGFMAGYMIVLSS